MKEITLELGGAHFNQGHADRITEEMIQAAGEEVTITLKNVATSSVPYLATVYGSELAELVARGRRL